MRFPFAALAVGLTTVLPLAAGDDGLTGHWKFSIFDPRGQQSLWLIRLDSKDGKLTASADVLKGAPKVKLEDIKLGGDTFTIKFRVLGGGPRDIVFDYEGKLPKPGAKRILGSFSEGTVALPAIMEATAAKTAFDVDRDFVLRTPSDPRAMETILDLIEKARDNGMTGKDLQALVDGSLKAAEGYGPRFLTKHQLNVLNALRGQKKYADIGAEIASKVVKQLDAKQSLDVQLQILGTSADSLRAGGKTADAVALDGRIEKLEKQAYEDHAKTALNFKPEAFKGRKSKSERAVLVELFTGAQCPPCVAADMAFDGLEKTYKPGEVVLLQYHLHIPGPDPLSNKDNDARFESYIEAYPAKVRGTPAILFNGKPDVPGGGAREDAPEKYKDYVDLLNKRLEAEGEVKLTAAATRKKDKIDITAKVEMSDRPAPKIRLRLALVEDWVRYKGSNGLQYHHRIVRAMPGGAKGIDVTQKSFEHKATIDLEELRASLHKYLDEDYRDGPRPMRLANLSVVAFVQNDGSLDVLQAVNVGVKSE